MAAPLTDIADRLTPSTPLELTFGEQPVATGTKITTIFAHKAASGGSGSPYLVHNMVNVGDPDAAKAEADALAGTGSQAGKMAYAFVKANSAVPGNANFPAFRIVLLANGDTGFGPSDEALAAVKNLRSDMIVSPYPASDSVNRGKLKDLCALLSGPDRDLVGQFGSFFTVGSIDTFSGTADSYDVDSQFAIVAYMQDQGLDSTGDVVSGNAVIHNVANPSGIAPGQLITSTDFPSGTTVLSVDGSTVTASANATATATAVAISFTNAQQGAEILAAMQAASIMQSAFPYFPLTGRIVGGAVAPANPQDRIVLDPNGLSELALKAGLSPMYVDSAGNVRIVRTRTTRVTTDGITPATAYFDWQDLVTMNDFREDCFLILQQPQFKQAKASIQTAALVKDEVLREAMAYENAQAFQAVKSLAPLFLVQPSATSRGRFDFKIPINVLPGLYVVAGNIQATTQFDFTL